MFSDYQSANLLPAAAILLTHLAYLIPAAFIALQSARLLLHPRSMAVWLFESGVCGIVTAILAVGILGSCRILSAASLFLLLWCAAGVLWLFSKGRGVFPPASTAPAAAVAGFAIAAGYLLFFRDVFSLMPSTGTDALLYHLFYPVTWIAEGNVDRIPQQGLVTAAYACYGEFIYAFNLIPTGCEFFARSISFYFLLLGVIGCFAAARALRLHPAAGAAAAILFAGCESFIVNASVANTDVILGVELLSAVVLVLFALRERRNRALWLLAGVMLGCAPATKLLGILLGPFLWLAVVLPVCFLYGRKSLRPLGCFTLGAFLAAAPYYFVNWFVTGSPAYPQKIALFGKPLFEAYLVTDAAPPVGLGVHTWGFFVGEGGMRTPLFTAVVILAAWLAGTATALFLAHRSRRARAGRIVLASIGIMLAVMTVVQCLVFPARTQPRMLIPILMLLILSGLPFWHLPAQKGRGWIAVSAAFLFAAAGESLRLSRLPVLPELTAFLTLLALFLLWERKLPFAKRLFLWLLPAAGLFGLVTIRFAQSNRAREYLLKETLPPESSEAIRLLAESDPQERGLKIAYTGIHYGLYTGVSGRNKVRSVPVSKSGLEGAWHYRTFLEERQDGGFECYLQRLRQGHFQYLLCEPHHFDAPRPDLEVQWALAHPQELPLLYHAGGLWLFRVTPDPREVQK